MKELGFHYKNWGYRATWHQKRLTIKQRSPKLVFIGLSRTSSYALFWTYFGLLRLSRWSFKKETNDIMPLPPILSKFFPNFKSLWRKPKICQIILSIWIYSPKVPLIYVPDWVFHLFSKCLLRNTPVFIPLICKWIGERGEEHRLSLCKIQCNMTQVDRSRGISKAQFYYFTFQHM